MPYNDLPSSGLKFQISIGTPTDIPGFTDFSWEGYSRAVRNPTHLQSPAVAKKPGLANWGQIKGKAWFDPNDATHQAVRDRLAQSAAYATTNLDEFTVIWPDGNTTPAQVQFHGFVSEFSIGATNPENGTIEASMNVEVSDIIAWSPGSA